jgi:Ca2+-binding EF-hand superfamily protein
MISGIGESGFSQSMAAQWNRPGQKDLSRMAQELFSSTDADGSGAIDQEELTAALAAKSRRGQGPDAAELFSAMDADGDGLVTEEEHVSGLVAMHKDLAQASMLTNMSMGQGMSSLAEALFTETDADGDGSITEEELTAAVAAKNEESGGNVDAAELFTLMDADGDGLITAAEHSAGLESLQGSDALSPRGGGVPQSSTSDSEGEAASYDVADTNEDGVVDVAEMLASLGATGGKDGQKTDLARILMSSKYEAYRLMGMDAQAYLSGGGLSVSA